VRRSVPPIGVHGARQRRGRRACPVRARCRAAVGPMRRRQPDRGSVRSADGPRRALAPHAGSAGGSTRARAPPAYAPQSSTPSVCSRFSTPRSTRRRPGRVAERRTGQRPSKPTLPRGRRSPIASLAWVGSASSIFPVVGLLLVLVLVLRQPRRAPGRSTPHGGGAWPEDATAVVAVCAGLVGTVCVCCGC
jgi:hypothetical protein